MSDAPSLFHLRRGEGRLLISVPHAGVYVPPEISAALNEIGRELPDTDWFVDRLLSFAEATDATVLVATHSRYVVDLNRGLDGAALYPGMAETGLVPTETFAGAPIWQVGPGAEEVAARVDRYWRPYHDALQAELARIAARHAGARLLDAHSIRSRVPRLFAGELPALNFGTNSGAACSGPLLARAVAAAGTDFSHVVDGRFRGGYITRTYGAPTHGVDALQLEIAQSTYMDEAAAPHWDARRAEALIAALRRVVSALLTA